MEENVLEVAALGRIFRPGMLYDVRTDKPVPTETLWNQETLDKAVKVTAQPGTEHKIEASDTIESKCSNLNINAGLKLSILGGLVSVGGSATYLSNRKSSEHMERVSLKYKVTTELKQLGMEVLAKLEYKDVLDKDIATHVVTAILYGGQAVFVFDRKVSAKESHRNIKGKLEAMVEKIPVVGVSGEGSLQMDDESKIESEHYKCTFHGDFVPSINPTTFKEAVRIYKELPSLIGSADGKSVPVMVWLHPLEKLDNRPKLIVRQISSNLVDQIERIFEEIQAVEMRCSDLIDHEASAKFTTIQTKLNDLKRYVANYRTTFQKRLMPVLPAVRGGGTDEDVLTQIIMDNNNSPFNSQNLSNWLDSNKSQLHVLGRHIAMMEGITFCGDPGEADMVIMDPDNNYVVAYVMYINRKQDPYIQLLKDYLADKRVSIDDVDQSLNAREKPWSEIVGTSRKFRDFATANSNNTKTTFIVSEKPIPDGEAEGGAIKVYQDALVIHDEFIPPSPPGIPETEPKTLDSMVVRFGCPKYGDKNVCAYEVSAKELASEDGDAPVRFDGTSRELTLRKLKPDTFYTCIVRSVSDVGHSLWSQPSKPFKCQLKSPPKEPEGEPEVHVGVQCDGCHDQIAGQRFKCCACHDNDLCKNCHENGVETVDHKSSDPVIVLPNPDVLHQHPWLRDTLVEVQQRFVTSTQEDEASDDSDQARSGIASGKRLQFGHGKVLSEDDSGDDDDDDHNLDGAFSGEDTILVIGGENSEGKCMDKAFSLESSFDIGVECSEVEELTLKKARRSHQSVSINDAIITIGGFNKRWLSSVERMDLVTDAKREIKKMNNPRDVFAAGVIGERIYVCGGSDGNILHSCEYYDTEVKKWKKFQDMNYIKCYHSGAVLNSILYATGGYPTHCPTECYNPMIDKWTTCPDLIEERYNHGCAALNGRIYVCGGDVSFNPDGHNSIESCECYDPRDKKWIKCSDMNTGRQRFAMVATDGKLYAIGGYTEGELSGSVDIYEPRKDKWITVDDVIVPLHSMSAVVL